METRQTHKKIVMIAKEEIFAAAMAKYAIQLAARLKFEVIAVNVNTSRLDHALFKKKAIELSAKAGFMKTAAANEVRWEYLVISKELGMAVDEIMARVKGVELILTNSEETKSEIMEYTSITVFSFKTQQNQRGESIMAEIENKKKPVGRMIGFGIGTAALYTAVFMNADTVTSYFTRGAWYAALPIATVFVFSFVHGAFASNLWSVLGIEAHNRAGKPADLKKSVKTSKRPVKRPRAYAARSQSRVNPFHRM